MVLRPLEEGRDDEEEEEEEEELLEEEEEEELLEEEDEKELLAPPLFVDGRATMPTPWSGLGADFLRANLGPRCPKACFSDGEPFFFASASRSLARFFLTTWREFERRMSRVVGAWGLVSCFGFGGRAAVALGAREGDEEDEERREGEGRGRGEFPYQ